MSQSNVMRVGAVNYLNSKPLIHRFEEHADRLAATEPALAEVRLLKDLPSRLADSLAEGRLDAALVPAFEALAEPTWRIVSDACVAADGPVSSVKVYFRKRPAEVRSLALDEGSRTSAALCRLLLTRRVGVAPQRTRLAIGRGLADTDADAVLLIGDRAMHEPPAALRSQFVAEWDLAEEWRRDTGLPFVFAVWAARPGIDAAALASLLEASRDDGLVAFAEIARREGPPLGLTVEHAERYLRQNLRFTLGPRERRGLELFREQCRDAGLLPDAPTTNSPENPLPVR
ncbi:Chorismate dehydratase [Botrimarina colliarenosi]|uniref:Chorismate dehydratase n=1 Tax=Botrimarina colliarenosi TaxID=2528001 RepID=A0A5C6AII1_9BACT|nr:menaquinone biosynthesis protein [Botrimarina colliarenosi]TWT98043.1 Chorismate dehydratase [Botrimarina colliarenosi]